MLIILNINILFLTSAKFFKYKFSCYIGSISDFDKTKYNFEVTRAFVFEKYSSSFDI